MHKPYVILVCPQLAENIGAVARSMSNFGLDNLRIVSPRDGWPPSDEAFRLAAKGSFVLDKAMLYDDLNVAIADLNFIVAATARSRYMVKKNMHPKKMVEYCNQKFDSDIKIGILFGRENNGLTNDELGLADVISIIPTNEQNSSLNLAQAVSIFAYEFYSQEVVKIGENYEICNKEEFNNLFDLLITSLERNDYFKEKNIKNTMIQNIRNIFVKAELSSQEVRTLMGIIKNLDK